MPEPLRIGNCSGFYGDRLSAMREQLEGGALDVLTGDYLAELTMLILGKDTMKDPSLGYARTFVRQVEECLGLALEKGVRIVSNAGGLNPAGLADRLREVARGLGLDPAIAHVEGDDLRPLGRWEGALTANAYLGGFGIAAALREGADVVVTGRVTDASLVVGPAAAHHGWDASSYDALAGAVVAGHVIECGTQATGGNFSGFLDLPGVSGRYGGARGESGATTQYGFGSGRETTGLSGSALGFPVAEVAADGSSLITKHAGTGGAVTVDTVTAQLVYEIQSTRYLGPDVTVDLASLVLSQHGPDRVQITGVRGEAPPERLKVCLNELGGWRNSAELVLTGLDLDAKEAWVRDQLEAAWGDRRPETVAWSRSAAPEPDAGVMDRGYSLLRCTVLDPDPKVAGKGLTGPLVELALGSYPGFTLTAPPSPATPYGVYRPEYVERSAVEHTVVHADGRRAVVGDPPVSTLPAGTDSEESAAGSSYPDRHDPPRDAETSGDLLADGGLRPFDYDHARLLPLGTFVHARSGDKGGDANLGLWVRHDGDVARRERRLAWLLDLVTPDRVRELLPEARDLDVDVHQLPNLGGVNVVVHGLLGLGVAASTRVDPQAKALGELVRARRVPIPEELL